MHRDGNDDGSGNKYCGSGRIIEHMHGEEVGSAVSTMDYQTGIASLTYKRLRSVWTMSIKWTKSTVIVPRLVYMYLQRT